MTKTMKKKGLFARMTALAMACAMALSVAAGAAAVEYTATLLKADGTTSHSNSMIASSATVDGNVITVEIEPIVASYNGTEYVGFVSDATCDNATITFEETSADYVSGYPVQIMTITCTDDDNAAIAAALSDGGLEIAFTSNTYKVNETDANTLTHSGTSTAYLALTTE